MLGIIVLYSLVSSLVLSTDKMNFDFKSFKVWRIQLRIKNTRIILLKKYPNEKTEHCCYVWIIYSIVIFKKEINTK